MKAILFFVSLLVSQSGFALDVQCSEHHSLDRGSSNSILVSFHNGGGQWTGYYRPYITLSYSNSGEFLGFDYDSNEVEIEEVSNSNYAARISVQKIYKDDQEVTCNILTSEQRTKLAIFNNQLRYYPPECEKDEDCVQPDERCHLHWCVRKQ